MKWNSKEKLIAFIHAAVMILIIILPALGTRLSDADPHEVWDLLEDEIEEFVPIFIVYLLNYYWLIPKYYRTNKNTYFLLNVLIILFCTIGIDFIEDGIFWEHKYFYAPRFYFFLAMDVLMFILSAACALAVHTIMRLQEVEVQLKEAKQQHAEAELVWLKNQLNPHFLFNTLNNISSLVQIDADTAQNSITQLSDLLRYALYETNKTEVNLADEVDFMNNYINLMRLRFSNKVKVKTHFEVPDQPVSIAPMLFISTLENAFKHGVSSHDESFIKASLHMEDDKLVFDCDNSYFPKKTDGRTGKGVGIENLKRRLNLLYPERNSYTQTLEDKVYHVEISIKV